MADYWKSQPKKFCQYCKCWIADNKPSIDFHERGKNHKENVAAKIAEIKKKSIDKAKLEERMSKEFAIMEEAALKAFQEDLKQLEAESGPVEAQSEKQNTQPLAATTKPSGNWVEGVTDDGLTYYYNTQTGESQWDKPEGFKARAKYSRKKEVVTQISSGCLWMEALSADGYTYYYNTETGESSWEKPTDYCSQSESSSSSQDSEIKQEPLPPQPETLSEEESISKVPCLVVQPEKPKDPKVPKISFRRKKEDISQPSGEEMGEDRDKDNNGSSCDNIEDSNSQPARLTEETPAKKPRKSNPYGEWEQIQKDEDPYEQVDLQLPQVEGASAATEATDAPTEPKVKFVERTITSLGDESDTGEVFRKRKLDNGKSRSLRQRGKDD